MKNDFEAELAAVVALVKSAELSKDARNTVDWCLQQLPALGHKFAATYESRYADEVLRLEQGMLGKLALENTTFVDALIEKLGNLHACLGLPTVDPKLRPAPVATPKKRKAV